mmetsp:Transcript_19604/g.23832  ORF Transcript_19604/g.23832 Transcript_19604/m.23832 type:complete len:197 (+) Transcript_19604:114-704(+)
MGGLLSLAEAQETIDPIIRETLMQEDDITEEEALRPIHMGRTADDLALLKFQTSDKQGRREKLTNSHAESETIIDISNHEQSSTHPNDHVIYNTVAGTDALKMARQLQLEREYQQRVLAKSVQEGYEKRRTRRRNPEKIMNDNLMRAKDSEVEIMKMPTLRKVKSRLTLRHKPVTEELKSKPFSNLRHQGVFGRFR